MSDIYDEMRKMIDDREAAAKAAEREAKDTERFDRIETSIGALAGAVEKLTHSAPPPPPGDGGGTGGEDPPAPPTGGDPPADPAPDLPVERVTRLDVPRVYNGDDEPAEVSYIDVESGETKKRKGRRKGHPAPYSVEDVELPPAEDPPPPADV
jgi:hypothetical protein